MLCLLFVCALHKQKQHTLGRFIKSLKIQQFYDKSDKSVINLFQRVQVPYGWCKAKPLVSRKVVFREECTEGSETTKVGTDGQELNMRHSRVG